MSETTSSSRAATGAIPGPDITPGGVDLPSGIASPPALTDSQPTIITHRIPATPDLVSDSAVRILQGRIIPGDRLGHFELVQYVGGGGMGRVFRAVDTRLARTVALKVLPIEQAADPETLQRFQQEAQSAARLDHENVARVHYVGEDRGLHYIVFEFIEGVNVRELVEKQGPLPLAEAVNYVLQVAHALEHAASRNVVHRDVKPSNLLLTPEGQVKLIDMGLARLRETNREAAELTASGVTLGTFDYISPEQARDPRNADVRSDIYSLGCTFFYMLTGRPPFLGGTVLQKLLQHQADQPPEIRQLRPDVPEELARLVRKMLAKDPRNRPGTPVELIDNLLAVAKAVGLRTPQSSPRPRGLAAGAGRRRLYRHLPWLVPVLALASVVTVLEHIWSQTEAIEYPPPIVHLEAVPPGPSVEATKGPAQNHPGDTAEPGVSNPAAKPGAATPSPGAPATAAPLGPVKKPSGEASAPVAVADVRQPTALPMKPSLDVLPASQRPAVKEKPVGSDVLIVSPDPVGANEFSSIEAACTVADNGDVIELCYNGPRVERPVRLNGIRLTIRAGEGYQPVVVFRPTAGMPAAKAGQGPYSRGMISISGGRLSLINVAVEVILAAESSAGPESCFELEGDAAVRMSRCWLSISRASPQPGVHASDAAFFRVKATPSFGRPRDRTPAVGAPASIELSDCVARGEAVALRAEGLQPVRFVWDNGLLATTQRLLSADGGASPPPVGETLHVDLRHLTAAVRGGLVQLSCTQAEPYQLPLRIDCADTILITAPGSPLIDQVGNDGPAVLRRRVAWSGERNFYEGFDVFWSVGRVDSDMPPEQMGFEAWRAFWGAENENLPRLAKIGWKTPLDVDRPVSGHTAADYALDEAKGNPAVGAASDGRNAGCLIDRLPPPPGKALAP